MELDRNIKERHSTRLFSGKKPDWREIILAIDAANSGPLAGNIPTLKFILVADKEKISKLAEAAQQDFVGVVDYVVVVCSNMGLIEKSYGDLAEVYARQQAGAGIQNFLLKINDLGLATCWVGAFAEDVVKTLLRIPDDAVVEALLPVGYARSPGKQRLKPHLDSCLYFDVWKNKHMKPWKMPPRDE